ncbi:MAG: carbon-nitrogen hydrolase family protein [Hyphomicrobiaceae bacterium]
MARSQETTHMSSDLCILACQIAVPDMTRQVERDNHLKTTAGHLREHLRKRPADLVVLPELSAINYSRQTFEHLGDLAEPLDGPSFQAFGPIAQEFGVTIVYGIPRIGDGNVHISQVVMDSDGQYAGHFDKLHRAQFGFSEEKEFFSPGDHLLTFSCKGIRVAPIICYDVRFPELTRKLVLDHGVELILHCGAYGRDESFDSWHAFVTTRAMENQVYVLSLNRAGTQFGDSIFCGPWVDAAHPAVRFPPYNEAFKYLHVSRKHLDAVRRNYAFLSDRFDSYSALPHKHCQDK